ncbi:LOW QUALITY PROTEIN: hemocytin [Nilaparvata lugens]|uniref:LOW QUALITY PROTEIN: hemocytin n=1 Tax=Nilaparvata lugens TaxID=108931 RepID=UPI00193CE989|nr:LOW QUALITY PROTEIN: hemocytin [Nilaparvata lugens]
MLRFFVISFSLLIFPVSSIVNRGKGTFGNYNQREVNGEHRQFHESGQNGSPHPAVEDERFFWDESEDPVADKTKMKHHTSSVLQQRVDHESPYIWKDSSDELHRDSRVHVIKEESHSVETTHHLKTDHDDNGASNGYGSYQADGWRPIKSSKQGGRNYNYYSKTSKKGGAFVSGSCETRLTAPMNSILRCSSYSGCQATCLRDYQFPNGETQLFFACQEGKWRVRGSTDDEIPQCHPSCLPPCQNGGICTSPNTCQCLQTFFGPYCQYEKKACTDSPPTPNNSKKICNSESCTIQCLPNHQFSDGSAIANVFCKEGVWIPGRPDWKTVPDCKPVCSPPCLNGGSCMTNNLCQCPQQYRGSQCQYSVDVCDARKLNFNGNYNCSGNGDYFSCSLTCPLGMSFSSNVAIGQVYTCDYATGTFMPSLVPQCVFGAGMDPNSNYHLSSHTLETINITKKTETNVGYLDLNKLFVLEKKPPSPGSCSIWGGSHYKTFDGSIVSFKSGCLYTLVSDLKDNKFNVQTQNTETDCLGSGCTRSFNIYINDILYRLLLNDAGMPEVRMSLQNFSVPSQLPDLRVDISGKMVITTLQSLNVKMVWNQKDLVDVEVGEELWNSTGGLCGTMDGHSTNDLTEFHESVVEYAEKWSVQTFGEVCQSKVVDALECGDAETQQAAHEFCNKIMIDPKFKQCRNIVMVREFYDACRWDFCACKQSSQGASNCACESIEMFVKECAKKGVTDIATWRDDTTCRKCSIRSSGWKLTSNIEDKIRFNKFKTKYNLAIRQAKICANDKAIIESSNRCKAAWRVIRAETGQRKIVMVREFYDACRWDFCACKQSSEGASNCACESIEMFVKECAKKGVTDIATWRDDTTCPMQCSGGKIYMSCGPATEATCRSQQSYSQPMHRCEEGCFCPEGTLAEDGHCILPKDCPCQLRGKSFKAGATVPSDCNTCTCVEGQWSCTDLLCTARCEAVGDPHYRTFDGRHYDFMGKCSYHLLRTDNFSISAENVACDGTISEAFGHSPSKSPSCTKAVTVQSNDGKTVIKLKQNKLITVNGEDVAAFPIMMNDIFIRAASSIFVQVELPDEINILWDGYSRVYIHVSPNLKGKTQYTFMTPEGDIEQDISSFADKWKAKETCDNISDQDGTEKTEKHPCDVKVQNRELAEAYCSNLTSRLFADCHMFVDPMPYYQNCLYDLCSCRSRKMSDCFCPMLAAYAKQCADQGAIIEWRGKVRECGLQCTGGQVYSVCGDSCTRTCQDIAGRGRFCRKECVDGCNCPEGRALDSRGDCVPISSCHCLREGMEYPPGHKDIQRSSKGLKLCKCESGAWNCKLATQEEIAKYPNEALEHKITCSSKKFQEFTHCLPAEPITCKNMHNYHNLLHSSAICRSGCICKRGFVLDSLTRECVKPTQCPCHHGGRSYLMVRRSKSRVTSVHVKPANGSVLNICVLLFVQHEVILSSTSFLNLTTMTVTTTILPEVNINDQLVCVPGWTDWINKHHPSLKEPNFDFENASAIDIMNQISQPINSTSNKIIKPQCGKNEMVEIQCREVETKRHYKELGQDVECTIDGGLICSDPNKCNDYEIRVLCQCKDSVTIPSQTTTTPRNEVELLSCNTSNPLTKHPTNCFKYFQCEETASGSFVQVERECTLNLWFNPETLTCDWPHSVLKIRPECEEISENINTNVGCVDTWSDWLNTSSPRNSGGDFELISVMQREHIDICSNNGYIKDIECQFVTTVEETRSGKYGEAFGRNFEYRNVKESPDVDVTCDKNLGLECVNDKQPSKMCQDYRIRVLCACEEKKEEQMNEKGNEQAPVTETVYQDCRSDEVYNDCLIKCDQLCHYYEHTLPRYTEYCSFKSRKQCLPGCSSLLNPVNCSTSGQRWRDFSSCVATNDCTCRSHNGTIVKPGQVFWESNCEACQCLNNHYVCDTSECLKTTIHPSSHVATSTLAPSTSPVEITTTTESHYSTTAEDIIYTESEAYETTKTTQKIFILTSTVSPPPVCNKDSYEPLLGGKKNVQLTSSSNSNFSKPEFGILIESNEKNWKPSINNQEQYLEINLGQIAPVYSIITAGDEHSGEFVTSYYVLYSNDGHTFSYVMDGAEPQLFRGPLTSLLTMQQEFSLPVEGQYFRINPNSWKEGIAMRVQLFGCSNEVPTTTSSTPIPTTTSRMEPVCTDKMGVESGAMRNKQISVSSHLDENFQAHDIALSSDRGWAPLIDSPHQWVQFDFLEERTITGVVTKGGSILVDGKDVENAWVEAYKVAYSHDGSEWSFIMDESDQPVKKVFVGNFDVNSPHKNFFNLPIHAQYLRIYPLKWHRSILLKIEILGCFVQYPEDVTTIRPEPTREGFSTTTEPEKCLVCLGVTFEGDSCPCLESSEKYWDGEKCSPKAQCPCVVGHFTYQVGSVYFETEECSTCTCTFGGISACSKQECPSCGEGKLVQRSSQCECLCVECEEGTTLCPTSNICINSTSWCDGFVDCPDDEKNCTVYVETSPVETTTPQSTTTVETKQLRCPPAECPPGFKVKLITSDNEESNDLEDLFSSGRLESTPAHASKSKWGSHFNKHGKRFYGGGLQSHWGRGDSFWSNGQYSHHRSSYSSYHTTRYHSHSYHGHHHGKTGSKFFGNHHQSKHDVDSDVERCPEYECIPIKKQNKVCVTPVCTKGYDLIEVESFSKTEDKCPKYVCKLTPMPDARCNITGRTFNTFDGLEFKYDVCDHVLAQSMADSNWQIRLVRTCSYIGPCKKSLKIKNFNNTIIFNTDMSVVYNGYDYTVEQCGKIGGQSLEFAIKKISDKFIIFKSILDFSVIWDMHGNVKIVVPHKFVGNVNGLCGLFDDDKENDRQKPDRTFAHSTIEFGDSWGNTESCETKVCPIEIQNKAWEMCMNVKKAPLAICGNVINFDKYLSQCVESICNCLEGHTSKVNTTEVEKCKCDALLDFVTECQESNPGIDISNWRVVNNCPVDCPAPFIYKECYNRICEMGCDDLMDDNPCPTSEGSCFPGCYCPDGLIREKDNCVKPLDCQDCVCDGFGKTRYVTFDRADYTFNSNCTYKLVETVPEFNEGPKFTIVATTGLCDYENGKTESTCIKSLTFVYGVHSAQVGGLSTKDNYHKLYLKTNIGEKTQKFPYRNRWIEVQENNGNGLLIHLVTTHVKVLFYGRDKGFSIHMPSQLYFNNTQGLCGRCNRNETDDFLTSDGVVQTENIELFGKSWRAIGVSSIIGEEKECDVIPQKEIECLPPPPDQDNCMKLLNGAIFGQCHAVIDPAPYVASCHESYCHDKESLDMCAELHSYARECMSAGICVEWRAQFECTLQCAPGLVYKPCSPGCLETCDNYNLLREKPEMCTDPNIEACVCPPGQVGISSISNWFIPDFFCRCLASSPARRAQSYVVVQRSDLMRFCNVSSFAECKPASECEDTGSELNKTRNAGLVAILVETGCCPEVKVICKKELCQQPPSCQKYFELQQVLSESADACCPTYSCEAPKDKCLYEFEFIEEPNSGVRKRNPNERYIEAKNGGEVWYDGPCHKCECSPTDFKSHCTTKQCSLPTTDSADYVVETMHISGQCCPVFIRTACKVDDTIYQEGEVWRSPSGDPCKNYTCVKNEDSKITKQDIVETCKKDCRKGWKYVEPSVDSKECCGQCQPFACVIDDGREMALNSVWYSDDNCTTYTCSAELDQVFISSSQQLCPPLEDCPEENIIKDGCCQKCNQTTPLAQSICAPESLPANETLKLIRHLDVKHGLCQNIEVLDNFTECRGACDSYTYYNKDTESHDSKCQCCQAVKYDSIHVSLSCEDGSIMEKAVFVPAKCVCMNCGA